MLTLAFRKITCTHINYVTSMCHSTQTVREWLHLMLNDHVAIDKVRGKYMLDNNDVSSPSVAIKSSDAMGFINTLNVSLYRNSAKSATISRMAI